MITAYYKPALAAFVNANGERHLLPVPTSAANLARVSWVNFFKRPASVFSFAFRHRKKVSPGNIVDCLREMMVFDHPANVQVFDRDHVEASDQISRNLVVKIFATARDLQMRIGDLCPLLLAPLRPLLFARKPFLLSLQVIQRALEMAWVFNIFAVRERGETCNPDIHANGLTSRRQWLGLGYLANKQSIPSINTACDGKLFALPFDRTAQPDATGANARDSEFIALERAGSDAFVFLGESVIAIPPFESWKARVLSVLNTSKEAFKSFVNTFKRVLLDCSQMAFHFGQSASVRQVARLLDIAERLARDLVAGYSFGKSGVVDLARMFHLALARLCKAFVGAKLKFVGLDCGIFSFSHRVTFNPTLPLVRVDEMVTRLINSPSVYYIHKHQTQNV
jgi:hypothetical protein